MSTTTPITDLIEKMLAKGAPMEAIVEAVREIETRCPGGQSGQSTMSTTCPPHVPGTVPVDIIRRRERERKKKALWRAKKKSVPGTVHQAQERTIGVSNILTLPLENNNLSPSVKKSKKVDKKGDKKRDKRNGCRIPDGWVPSVDLHDFAYNLGIDGQHYDRELERFRDYWKGIPGHRGVKLDWDGTWRNRLRQISDWKQEKVNGQNHVKTTVNGGGSNEPTYRSLTREQWIFTFGREPSESERDPGPGQRGHG